MFIVALVSCTLHSMSRDTVAQQTVLDFARVMCWSIAHRIPSVSLWSSLVIPISLTLAVSPDVKGRSLSCLFSHLFAPFCAARHVMCRFGSQSAPNRDRVMQCKLVM